jgi:uncharacterized tellurite resistance protein B-like protein
MADWRKLSLALTVADGRIDTREVEILRRELFNDGKIDKSELEFLGACRKHAESSVRAFWDLFSQAVKAHMLADGEISDAEAKWLRKNLLADGTLDPAEKQLIKELKAHAKSTGPEFDKLVKEAELA